MFSCARPADEHDILRSVHELASVQLAHGCFVDLLISLAAKSYPEMSL